MQSLALQSFDLSEIKKCNLQVAGTKQVSVEIKELPVFTWNFTLFRILRIFALQGESEILTCGILVVYCQLSLFCPSLTVMLSYTEHPFSPRSSDDDAPSDPASNSPLSRITARVTFILTSRVCICELLEPGFETKDS